jgi:hypothetical protein
MHMRRAPDPACVQPVGEHERIGSWITGWFLRAARPAAVYDSADGAAL